jgi:hypothetical protein
MGLSQTVTEAELNKKRASPFFRINCRMQFTNGGKRCQGKSQTIAPAVVPGGDDHVM